MNSENSKKLVTSFPKVYPEQYPLAPLDREMQFYFRCEDGWFNLLWDLSQKISDEVERAEEQSGTKWEPIAVQVKEKFGALRFYVSARTEDISNAIAEAEQLSKTTCEICGKPGILRDGCWIKVRCDNHISD